MVMEKETKKIHPKEEEPMKIYDKYMYKSQEKMKNIILIISVFIIGFICGYVCEYGEIKKLNNEIRELHQNENIQETME